MLHGAGEADDARCRGGRAALCRDDSGRRDGDIFFCAAREREVAVTAAGAGGEGDSFALRIVNRAQAVVAEDEACLFCARRRQRAVVERGDRGTRASARYRRVEIKSVARRDGDSRIGRSLFGGEEIRESFFFDNDFTVNDGEVIRNGSFFRINGSEVGVRVLTVGAQSLQLQRGGNGSPVDDDIVGVAVFNFEAQIFFAFGCDARALDAPNAFADFPEFAVGSSAADTGHFDARHIELEFCGGSAVCRADVEFFGAVARQACEVDEIRRVERNFVGGGVA